MTWLTPLFLAAGIAIIGPILFHMWQRTPRGRRLFSTTLFLTASPPRITRRSRIVNWPLLCLRAFALLLLAVGFARPVWRSESQAPTISSPDKTVAILVDISASLQRDGLWDSLIDQVTNRLDRLPASTQVGLFAFDHGWKPHVGFEHTDRLETAARRQRVREQLQTLRPGQGATQLGEALAKTMQALRENESSRPVREATEIWLATDLATGVDLTGLAGIDWPESTRLEIIAPESDVGSNAGLQWVESPADAQSKERRVRVTNAKLSKKDRFYLGWDDASATADRIEVHVPAGQSRTLLAPPRPENLPENIPLRLFGDDHEFDNRLWAAEFRPRAIWILYLGADAPDDSTGSRFFLEQALAGTSDAEISLRTVDELDESLEQNNRHGSNAAAPPALTVWTETSIEPPAWMRGVVERGGSLLMSPRNADELRKMLAFLDVTVTDVQEAAVKEYSLLSDIDFEDPLFASFASARFADFTGIHFWRHRQVQLNDSAPARVLARFDDGAPFLVQQAVGEGRSWLLTSGWHPADSQLARSSKFAPLLHRLIEQSTPLTNGTSCGNVGRPITWPLLRGEGPVTIQQPDQTIIELTDPELISHDAAVTGIYVVTRNGESETWAVNIAPEESKTDPFPVEALERFGVRAKGSARDEAEVISPVQQRQLQLEELERRQSWWRWCLLSAGLVLLIETAWAGRTLQSPPFQPPD